MQYNLKQMHYTETKMIDVEEERRSYLPPLSEELSVRLSSAAVNDIQSYKEETGAWDDDDSENTNS